jgi:hypothetical protein
VSALSLATEGLARAAGVAASNPTPYPGYTGNPNLITPGVWGFIAILLVGVATIFLLLDMNRRIRRSRYREEVRAKLEEEQAEADRAADAAARKNRRGRSDPLDGRNEA